MTEQVKEVETEVAPVESVSDRDAINDDVRAAIDSLKGEAPAEVAEAPAATVEAPEVAPVVKADHPSDPLRFADGTFKPVKTEAAPAKAAPDQKSPPPDDPAKASAQPSTAGAPPVSWAADAKQAWAALPPAIQTAVIKREREVSDGFRQKSDDVRRYEQVLSPVAQEAAKWGLSVEQGTQRLLDGHRFLEAQPAEAILWLANKHGINLTELASNPPAPQRQARTDTIPPEIIQRISSQEQRIADLVTDQNMAKAEAFAAKNDHYADVEEQLPALMREISAANPELYGVPLLQAAYNRAIWLNPDVRAKLITEQQAQTTQAATAKVHAKAAQAGKAAVSIRGSSADTRPPPKPQMNGTVYDDVRAAIEQVRAS